MQDLRTTNAKMDVNREEMKNEMKENAQRMESMENQIRGEMQSMGLNLQAGQEAIRAITRGEMRAMGEKMAPARGGTTESGGSVAAVGSAMETGEVEGTSDATTIRGEINKLGHEGTTEKSR